ncbi:MAG: hypothetical protein ACRDLB_13695 [Actinomycetota bacterium]
MQASRRRARDTAGPIDDSEVPTLFAGLLQRVQADGYTGYEWGDVLNSPMLERIPRRSLMAARVLIQIGSRSPVNVRPLLRVPRSSSTKGMGFVAKGLLKAHRALGEQGWLVEAEHLLDRLLRYPSEGYSGLGWGNDFDFASRGGFYPKGIPTVVWTSHIGEAFLLAFETTQDERYRDAVVSGARFVLNDLERHEDEDGVCIAYAPGRLNLVHNSNLLGGVALLRAWRITGEAEYFEVAREAYRWSLSHMARDGSFRYGVGSEWGWVDNFHTGYVLDCLLEGRHLGGDEIASGEAIDLAFGYWRDNFFLDDGAPKYYNDRAHPFDIQCAAQAIETFCRFSARTPEALDRARLVLTWTVGNMMRRDGYFMYRRGRYFNNRLACFHWGQATMLDAMGSFIEGTTKAAPR